MENIIDLLHEGKYSCVIFNKEIRTFAKRGVADFYELLNNDAAFLEGSFIADKIVGNAVVVLMVLVGIKRYIQTLSVYRH